MSYEEKLKELNITLPEAKAVLSGSFLKKSSNKSIDELINFYTL